MNRSAHFRLWRVVIRRAACFTEIRQFRVSILTLLLCASGLAFGETEAEALQRKLNDEVTASAFNAGDIKKADAFANDALKKGIQPVSTAPTYWQPGWTCSYLTSYRYYNYYDYRNCIHYHRHYGRYW